jgi:hypothetical protein
VCPELESVADFVPCCADKLLSMCADPAVAMQTLVCSNEAEARGAALEQCSSTLSRIIAEVYGFEK